MTKSILVALLIPVGMLAQNPQQYVKQFFLPAESVEHPTTWRDATWVAAAPGAIWFTEYYANKVGRITTGGVVSEFSLPESPLRVAIGPDGAPWVTTVGGDGSGRIRRIGN